MWRKKSEYGLYSRAARQLLELTRSLSVRRLSSGNGRHTPPSSIRNVGIMAHIDAGKTTTTERMLYYAGFTRHMGDVDDGDTVMDYMQQERERGITINSAAITFDWLQHRVNLIDTPGHVDFTFEVERSLRVLDGAVALFDGSAGVEAQSVAVWRQADHYGIPRVAFVNKMDKPGASLSLTVDSMKRKLSATPLVTQLPLGQGKEFTGVIDLLSMDLLVWERGSDGSEYARVPLLKGDPQTGRKEFAGLTGLLGSGWKFGDYPVSRERVKEALEYRSLLAEQVVSMDDQLIDRIADDSFDPLTLSHEELEGGIHRLTKACLATPLLCGSSLQNVAVQPLMSAILSYLPGPEERRIAVPEELKELYAYAFKVTHDKQRGPLVYMRLYSGQIQPHTTVYNLSRHTEERVSRVLLMLADEQREVKCMEEGNIAVAVGMKNTYTGDTIVRSEVAAKLASDHTASAGEGYLMLESIDIPPPVFFCSIEPASAAYQKDLDHALSCLSREDPSLRVSTNPETAQTVLSGMGELHLEIIHDRLRREYGVDCALGRLQVSYKEQPMLAVTHEATLDRSVGSKRHIVSLTLDIAPTPKSADSPHGKPLVYLDLSKQRHDTLPGGYTKHQLLEAVKEGVEGGCLQGPLLSFPVHYLTVTITSLTLGPATSLAMLASCTSEGVVSALRRAEVQLLEPCTQLEVTVPEEHVGKVLGDLTSHRRAHIQEVGQGVQGEERVVTALTPLACLRGYSTVLRTMTSGMGTFVTGFSHYEPVSREQEKLVTQELRGYI